MRSVWIVSALLLVAWNSMAADSAWQFSADELACAQARGIDLTTVPRGGSVEFLGHLTWLSDAVVIGKVVAIRHDLDGPYPTLVQLEISDSLKGGLAGTIAIALQAGSSYSEASGTFGEVFVSHEPRFETGEEVLVFLTTKYPVIPEAPDLYVLPSNTYRPLADTKYVLDSTSATLAADLVVPRIRAREEILSTVAYAASCDRNPPRQQPRTGDAR